MHFFDTPIRLLTIYAQLDTEAGTTEAQRDSALRLLLRDSRIWWRSIFPPESPPKAKKKKKGKGKKGKGAGKRLAKKAAK